MLQLLTPVSVRINGHSKKGEVRGRWTHDGVEYYDVMIEKTLEIEQRVTIDRLEVLGEAPPIGGGKAKEPLPPKVDPRDPDYSRPSPFDHHNCARCSDGAKPCVTGKPHGCEYLHARND